MKHYCTVCRKIHAGRCARPREYRGSRNTQADRFRNTQAWRRKAAAILERDYHCCRVCACRSSRRSGLRRSGGGIICTQNLSVHHIIPLAVDYDRRLDDDNLITLCRYHHERAERGVLSARELRQLVVRGFSPDDIPPPTGDIDKWCAGDIDKWIT